jgi:processive 1,2-diacylglycerol beta-glucosyltransferase
MKILVIHASAGAGHLKAAEALYHGLKALTGHEAVLADALDYTSPFFKGFYKKTYFFLISKIPWVWGFFFAVLDCSWLQPLARPVRRLYNRLNADGLHRFLREQQFDCVFTTHFMPTEVAAALKRKGDIRSRLITVITDFDAHRIWLADGVDKYAVATGWTKDKMKRLGVPEEDVLVSGIPTAEKFSSSMDAAALKSQLGLEPGIFTVLVATGSFGIGPIEDIIRTFQGRFQIIVVCGHNRGLYEKLTHGCYSRVKVFGLVDNMPELMAVSDAMVTKPGGLSIAEALVRKLPLVFFNAIPGQESGNVKVLKTYGVGLSGRSIGQMSQELEKMRSSSGVYLAARKKIEPLARPLAVRDILSLIK